MVRRTQGEDHTPKGLEERLYDWFTDVQLSADIRKDAPCPPEAALLILADRWHRPPWELQDAPADDYLRWMHILGVEAEAHADRAGLSPDEPSYQLD